MTRGLDASTADVSDWKSHAAEAEAWEREHEVEWRRVDQKLRGIAARRAALDAEEANLLRYAEELKLWRAFGFGSLLEYMERAMGYAPRTATERLRVARAIAELPLVAEALETGALAHSAVRELSRVAVPETEAVWLEAASGKTLREIEAMVSGHKPGDLPDDETEPHLHRKTITLEVSPETYDIWRKLHALAAEEHGQRLSDDELISSLFRRAYVDGANQSSTPAYKLAIKQCPDCKRSWQFSGGRDIEIDPSVAECAACDAVHLGSLDASTPQRTTTTVTPRKREQVLARDGHCCTVPGCRRNVGLDLHHIEYQSRGGGHALHNLTTTCDLHHKAIHAGKLLIRGTAPDHLIFEFQQPRNRRNVIDDSDPPSPLARPSPSTQLTGTGAPTWAAAPPPQHTHGGRSAPIPSTHSATTAPIPDAHHNLSDPKHAASERALSDPKHAASERALSDPKHPASERALSDPKHPASERALSDPKHAASERALSDPKHAASERALSDPRHEPSERGRSDPKRTPRPQPVRSQARTRRTQPL